MTDHVTVFEMSPRDGLQNETHQVSTSDKIKLVDLLSEAGLSKIEVASFVNPKAVPQMADGTDVLAGITRRSDIRYTALTPNMRGFENALRAKPDEIAVFASASEGFSKANINCTIDESLSRFQPVLDAARLRDIPVRGYVSCVADCPYDGPTPPSSVAAVSKSLQDMGCYQISLGDTIGSGSPERVSEMLQAVLKVVPARHLAGHFHDTKGYALDNISASLDLGLRVFDASAGGLGGCPFAPGADGNVATEAVVSRLHDTGFETGIDLAKLKKAATFAKTLRSGS